MYLLQGQYEDKKTSCVECPAGTHNNVEGKSGQSSCKECPDGYIAAKPGMMTCTPCQPVSDVNLII